MTENGKACGALCTLPPRRRSPAPALPTWELKGGICTPRATPDGNSTSRGVLEPWAAREGLQPLSSTCGDFYTGIFAHVAQLDNDVVFASGFQLAQRILHRTVPGLEFVVPVALSY